MPVPPPPWDVGEDRDLSDVSNVLAYHVRGGLVALLNLLIGHRLRSWLQWQVCRRCVRSKGATVRYGTVHTSKTQNAAADPPAPRLEGLGLSSTHPQATVPWLLEISITPRLLDRGPPLLLACRRPRQNITKFSAINAGRLRSGVERDGLIRREPLQVCILLICAILAPADLIHR